MAIPLTVGRPPPIRNTYGAGAAGGGGFQPQQAGYKNPYLTSGYTAPGGPAARAGGQWMPSSDQQGNQAAAGQLPTIQLPVGTAATPAYTPDYSSMIGSSWEVGAAESAMASQMAAARAAFQQQLRQNFIDLGYSGDMTKENGLGDFSKYIDKDTIQKAIDNKYSAYNTIKQQQEKTDAYNAAMLTSSGLSQGGTATATAQDTVNQAEQARYEGLRNFLSGGQQGLSGLTQLKAQLASSVMQARFAAAQRLAAMYPPTPAVPATTPNWDDFWGSYQGGVWSLPGTGGYIVPSGVPGDQGQPQPWYVGPGSGVPGDLSWLHPH